ncbi:hypothetical protein EON77_07510, partial [bacterium]
SGIGSDEIFAGYSNFRRFAVARKLARNAPASRRVDRAVARATGWPRLPAEARKLAMLVRARGDAGRTYAGLRGMFAPSQVAALLAEREDILGAFDEGPHGGPPPVTSTPGC